MQTTKPTKQRKAIYQAPDHRSHKLFAAPLSSSLKSSQGLKTIPVRSGDTVRIMRGDHEGFEGKITRINRKKYRVYVEGLTREKVDGTTVFIPIHPSKVMITNLNLDDKWRREVLERKKEARKRVGEVTEKPARKPMKEEVEEVAEEKVTVEKKPRARKRRTARKPAVAKMKEKEAEEAPKEEKPEPKKARARRKTAKEVTGGA
jgi:large subunit ribosomal protein L24